jgi:hypothetical protein
MIDDNLDEEIKDLFRTFGYDIRDKLLFKGLDNNFGFPSYGKTQVSQVIIKSLRCESDSNLIVNTKLLKEKLALRVIEFIPYSINSDLNDKIVIQQRIEDFYLWCSQYN